MADEQQSENEKRIRTLTKLYYSNPKVQEAILKFSRDRESVPRYFEGFGKRPDVLQYPSDIIGLVQRGATSFHSSEELWADALQLSSDITKEKMDELRKGWDLLIDIDSLYLDFSKMAAKLLIEELEYYGIKNYGIKFSGSKGFHIIVSSKAFPSEFNGQLMKNSFPEWPRAICEFLMNKIKPRFARDTHNISDIGAIELRTSKKKDEITEIVCPQCGKPVHKDKWVTLSCDYCSNEEQQRKSIIERKRIIRCGKCMGEMAIVNEKDLFECLDCKITNIQKLDADDSKVIKYTKDANIEEAVEMHQGLQEGVRGGFDLVLVAPRHLFRMPYSLHEKTSLASVVLRKEDIGSFVPRDADPMKIKIIDYLPENTDGEAKRLLASALNWKNTEQAKEEKLINEKYKKYENKEFENIDSSKVTESMFPNPIKKLLKGLKDGKKRGLFILITFLKSINYSPEQINLKVREWNKLNEPPLKEGYIRSQIDWHLKQKKKIMPPNYDNPSFYKDLGLLDKKPDAKNPLSEIAREIKRQR